jgi:hypothetical protein
VDRLGLGRSIGLSKLIDLPHLARRIHGFRISDKYFTSQRGVLHEGAKTGKKEKSRN